VGDRPDETDRWAGWSNRTVVNHRRCATVHLGDGREHDAVNTLLRSDIENRMHPNPLVIGLTDDRLFRYGRINAALAENAPGTPNGASSSAISP
jgi:hypothetical protein